MADIMEAMPGFKFGADPELFLLDMNTGEFASPEGFVPGTKSEPYPVIGGAVQIDGMAAEFNIDPVDNYEDFDMNIRKVLKSLRSFLPKHYDLCAVPSVEFSQQVWDKAPARAKELGCTPDFNAWTGSVNPPPHDPENPTLRTGSGHLHIGWTDDADVTSLEHMSNARDLVKQLDYYLGAWSLTQDKDPTRRRLYGKAGAMRYKPYGVEYRVLSNFWVLNASKRLAVWNRMQQAIWDMRNLYLPDMAEKFKFNDTLIESIDTSKLDPSFSKSFKFPIQTLNQSYLQL